MPSEAPAQVGWLRSQGLGLLCGQATVVLLAVGSVTLVATREGASAEIQMEDLTAFFTHPSPVHWWFYALVLVLCVYALNTALCTWDSVRQKLERRTTEAGAWAPAAIHVSFLIALVAHAIGGVWTVDREPVVVAADWVDVGLGRSARLVSLDAERLASGRPKRAEARLEVKDGAGQVRQVVVGYNQPLTAKLGTDVLLLEQAGEVPSAPRFSLGELRCSAAAHAGCALGQVHLEVLAVQEQGHWGDTPVAIVRVTKPDGSTAQAYLLEGVAQDLESLGALRFEGSDRQPAVLLRGKTAPGNPWALASGLVMTLGLVLMGRRWV